MKIAHIINVTEINESKKSSYLHIAQPLTMKSMVVALENAKNVVDVELYAVKHDSESVDIISGFDWAKSIEKYAWEYIDNLKDFTPIRPLPRICDIIYSLYESSNADYFIYTNVDIGLYPTFYITVKEYIEQGYDAFCINRRDLPKEYKGVLLDADKYELCCMIEGKRHPGTDCFVFKREIVPLLKLGNVFVGYPPVGELLRSQIIQHSKNFKWIRDERATFHLGEDRVWRGHQNTYWNENIKQAEGLIYVPPERQDRNLIRSFAHRIKKRLVA